MKKDRIAMITERRAVPLALLLAAVLGGCAASPPADSPWKPCGGDRAMMGAVKAEFLHVWHSYRERGLGHDGLNPTTGLFSDPCGVPLAATLVDSLDALWLMGEEEEFERAAEWAAQNVSFDRDAVIDTAAAATRFLGGLLSAYQISGDERLLELARDMGDRLLPAFASPTGLPYASVNLKTGRPSRPRTTPGNVGVLALELGLLARLAGEPEYARPAQAALFLLWERRSALGLPGGGIDVETGEWTDRTSHVDSGIGPFYSALLKTAVLLDDDALRRIHRHAFVAARRYLRCVRRGVPWYSSAQMDQGVPQDAYQGAASAFWPGHLVLAGELEDAVLLQDAWFAVWERFGAEPEFYDCEKGAVLSAAYTLQPGIVESALYLWRRTGDARYREQGRRILRDLKARCRAPFGYAPLADVVTGERAESAGNCFPADIFRALYLLFAPGDTVDLDEWVLGPGMRLLQKP